MENKKAKPYETGKAILEKLLAVEISNQDDVLGNKKKMTIAELMHVRMVKKALDGDLKAYAEVLDRVEGKAVQKIEDEHTIKFNNTPLSQLVQFTTPTKTLDENTNEVIELKQASDGVFKLDIDFVEKTDSGDVVIPDSFEEED